MCVTLWVPLFFVFSEIRRNLLGRVCRVIWCDRGGHGSKEGGKLVGARAGSLGVTILIRLSADARAGGSVLLSCFSRRALLAAERLPALRSRPSAGLISLARLAVDWEPCLVSMLMDLGAKVTRWGQASRLCESIEKVQVGHAGRKREVRADRKSPHPLLRKGWATRKVKGKSLGHSPIPWSMRKVWHPKTST